MKMPSLPSVRPVDLTVVLAALYFLTVTVVPFEALDRSLARLLFNYGSAGWSDAWLWAVPLYGGAKWTAGLIAAAVLFFAVKAYRDNRQPLADALIRTLAAVLLSLGLMLLMKHFSGVACPWSLPEFSAKHAEVITPFSWLFTDVASQGRCWPAGHASTGFCLFGLFFAARRLKKTWAGWVFAAVLLFGSLCAFGRMLQGAHFLSHSMASLLMEFAVAGLIFWPDAKERKVMNVTQAAFFAAVPLTLLALPFFSELASHATLKSFTALIASLAFFGLIWVGVFLVLVRWMPRCGWRIILALLALVGAGADAFTTLYGTVMTPDMVRNALATDWREATELVGWRWAVRTLLFALPALAVAFFAPTVERETARDFRGKLRYATRAVLLTVVTMGFLLSQFSTLSAFMRNQKEARYLIEPVAVIYSFVRTLVSDGTPQKKERLVIDPNPVLTSAASDKQLLVVMVVGETVRAADWGLNGYERNTTPELARRGVINFTDVTACGTSTDVSLPCMFSRVGRKDYDRDRILTEESVLSVIDRAGVTVRWADNQSGCKGACTNAMEIPVTANAGDCPSGTCWDKAMLGNIDEALQAGTKRELLVLHSMGNHGPAYWRRTPPAFRPFGKGCLKDDLGECRPEDVVVSYDNAVAYADQFLAAAIDKLAAVKDRDTVLLYVSDHGESLGEKGLWLHGAPYWTHLSEQTKVPMILWMNDSARRRFNVTQPAGNVSTPVTHDNLADTLFELTGVQSVVQHPQESLLSRLRP